MTMTPTDIIKLVTESGLGVVAFAALLYGGWRLLNWLEEVKSNHLAHIQESLGKIAEGTERQNGKLDAHGEKLDRIVEQTRK